MTWYVMDGMDGSGKSTAACSLKKLLTDKGRSVRIFAHPNDDNVFGRMSHRLLLKCGIPAKLYSAAFLICDILCSLFSMKRKGYDDVIFVRYTMSSCYMPSHTYRIIYDVLTAVLPKPDVKIYLDISAEDAFERIGSRGDDLEMFENLKSLEITRDRMLSVCDDWIIIDAGQSQDQVSEILRGIVK